MKFQGRRSAVYSTNGMVASTQPLANQAGIMVLEKGGNAIDSAIAVASALNVLEPMSTGIGGDMFILYYEKKSSKVYGINGSGKSSQHANLEKVLQYHKSKIPFDSVHAVTVPGAAAAWVDAVEKFGSGISLEEILAPAIQLASAGFPVSEITASMWKAKESLLKSRLPNSFEYLPKGSAPEQGDLVTFPNLAKTFAKVARFGKDGFYKGEVAEAIVESVNSYGGCFSLEDLADHKTIFTDPISVGFYDLMVYEHGPNGQGIVALMVMRMLQILEKNGFIKPLKELKHNSSEYIHIITELLKIAFADAEWYVTDPEAVNVPSKGLLDEEYLKMRAQMVDFKKSSPIPDHGLPKYSGDTVYYSIIDKDGNACSVVNSLYTGFGSGIVAHDTGVILHCRGSNFSLNPECPNVFGPCKRTYHTIIPAMTTHKDGKLDMSFGVMGGFMQPQGHSQVLLNRKVFGFDVQESLDAPRFCLDNETGKLSLEEGIDVSVLEELKCMGHDVNFVYGTDRALFGRGQIIEVNHFNNTLCGGSDSRGDGQAVPILNFN
jgi:gamma-glutamyltranspeptidase / glutathione hydrolase